MQQDQERIVRRAELDGTLCAQAGGVGPRENEFCKPLDEQERDQPRPLTHAQPRARADLR